MYSDISWNNPKLGVMAPNKGPSGFAIAWDSGSAVVEKGKKKIFEGSVPRGSQARGKGGSQAFPSPVNCVAHFAHQFLFFCCFTLFWPLFPTMMTGLRLFLLQVLGFAIQWYP